MSCVTTGGKQTQLLGMCVLHDFKGVSMGNMDSRVAKTMMRLMSGSLPSRLGGIYLLNPPFFLNWVVLPLVKRFANKKMRERLHVCTSRKKLLKYFDESQLPQEYDGPLDSESFWDRQVNRKFYDLVCPLQKDQLSDANVEMLAEKLSDGANLDLHSLVSSIAI